VTCEDALAKHMLDFRVEHMLRSNAQASGSSIATYVTNGTNEDSGSVREKSCVKQRARKIAKNGDDLGHVRELSTIARCAAIS